MDNETSFKKAQLNKGKACFNCRRRKVKCDAKKPICTPCVRFIGGGLHDCEYTEVGPAQSQVLEEQISIIESRIQELQQPKEFRTSVGLHNPYHHRSSSTQKFDVFAPVGGSSHHNPGPSDSMERPRSMSFFQALITVFMRYASQIGFFLSPHLFEALSSGAAPSQIASPALLDAIYLWGSHLSGSEKLSIYESGFLSDALRSTAASLSKAYSASAIIQTIQAKVLLAQYFFRNARILEGKYHASAAVSISLSSGLHKIRSADVRDSARPTVDSLSPAANALEEGERINAFWSVLTLNNCWFAADGSPADVSHTAHGVDTPWPLEIGAYSEDSRLLPFQSSATIDNFLANFPDRGTSLPALHAKAGVVFEQAARLAARYTESAAHRSQSALDGEFGTLDGVIEAFKQALPRVDPKAKSNLNHDAQAQMLVVHTLAQAATIQLHNPFSLKSAMSRARAGASAMAIVALLRQTDVREFGHVDAIVGTLWTAACQVLTTELSRARYGGGAYNVGQLCGAVETLLAAMSVFSRDCRLIELQLATAQQNYAAVRNANR
ncbi:Zn(2)-Cys(6) binuclear cluster domain-containing protein [Mycena vulgaris]|nr:Zn(2)-Cys(6) binuclear cluster domain-containing protein [Mycena vulgaris]